MTEQSSTSQSRAQQREFRRVLGNAVGMLRSDEARNSYASLSLEELIDKQIDKLEGSDGMNPSRLARIRSVRQELSDSIEGMKATPPENFRRHDPNEDANTAPEGS